MSQIQPSNLTLKDIQNLQTKETKLFNELKINRTKLTLEQKRKIYMNMYFILV
jgi:hypothetical protein